MGGGDGFGEFERHDDHRAGAALRRMKKAPGIKGFDPALEVIIIKCSCSVQWNCGMSRNELGLAGPGEGWRNRRGAHMEGITMISTSFRVAFSALFFAGALGLASTGPVQAQSIMKQCGDDWKAAKENNTTNGMKWPDFLKQCRVQKEGAAAPAAAPVAAPLPLPLR